MNTLKEYYTKRDFKKTPEPIAKKKIDTQNIFVIQQHHARRLHYDLRLQIENVLKSWAVPKGPSLDPTERRNAIQTEDHPLEYANFEGEIPPGNYGAGRVFIWDKGAWENRTFKDGQTITSKQALHKGHLTFILKGERLKGSFSLIQTKNSNWLLIKAKDEFAQQREEPLISSAKTITEKMFSFTQVNKRLFAEYSKKDLLKYYSLAAPLILYHIRDHPLSLYRFPDGIAGEKFFQKQKPKYFPEWLHSILIKDTEYVYVQAQEDILYLANQVAEFHAFITSYNTNCPDRMIFDFDPQLQDLETLRYILEQFKKFLHQLGIISFIMTTGRKGYHLAVPLKPTTEQRKVADFSQKIVKVFARFYKEVTIEFIKEKRKDRIFIDTYRNSPSQTSVVPYTVRATEKATIAAPIFWKELLQIAPDHFTLKNITERLQKDPWIDFRLHAIDLQHVISRIKKI